MKEYMIHKSSDKTYYFNRNIYIFTSNHKRCRQKREKKEEEEITIDFLTI